LGRTVARADGQNEPNGVADEERLEGWKAEISPLAPEKSSLPVTEPYLSYSQLTGISQIPAKISHCWLMLNFCWPLEEALVLGPRLKINPGFEIKMLNKFNQFTHAFGDIFGGWVF
jgi:hypothetical protein